MGNQNKELFAIFIKMEQEGKEFYKELASYISDPVVKEFLLFMSTDEARHENKFKEILKKKEDLKYCWEDNPTFRDLLDKHLKEGFFPKLDAILEHLPRFEGLQKALEFALESEERSVEFFSTLSKCCDDFETKNLLIELKSEEKAHCEYILKLILDLEKK